MDGKQHKPTQQGSEVQIALVDLIHLSQQEGNYNPEDDREEDRLCREVQTVCGQALAHIDRLTSMVYETAPGEYSPDGWTYKQAFEAEVKRRKEAEHTLEEVAELRHKVSTAEEHARVLARFHIMVHPIVEKRWTWNEVNAALDWMKGLKP